MSDEFDGYLHAIKDVTSRIKTLREFQERLIAEADATSPHANRRAIGKAADMAPSQLLVVLERNGRPRNRAKP